MEKKNSKKRNFKKGLSKDKSKENESIDSKESANLKNVSRYGDPNWYFLNKDLADQASQMSFKAFIGDGQLTGDAKLPSICTFGMNPFIGTYQENYQNQVAAVVMAARKLYARLSSKTGRTSSYAPQDVMTIILAVGEIISITSHLKRVLGLAFNYQYRNRDFPNNIIRALGVDPDDLFENLSVYWTRLNTSLNQINKIPIPANISWFQKCGHMYMNVFKDSPDAMSQIYAFIPATTWQIDENTLESGTILSTISACYDVNYMHVRTYVRTFGAWIDILDGMVQALLTSTSYNVVYADILNLASKDNIALLHLDIIPLDYHVEPVYDQEFLLHVHNLFVNKPRWNDTLGMGTLDTIYATPRNDVYPNVDANSLYQYPIFEIPGTASLDPFYVTNFMIRPINLVDFPYGDPDVTERIEATRFACRYLPHVDKWAADDTSFITNFAAAGDHYCVGMDLYIGGEKVTGGSNVFYGYIPSSGTLTNFAILIDKFDYHPYFYKLNDTGVSGVLGDVNYFTNIGYDQLRRIDDLAFQGLFELRD